MLRCIVRTNVCIGLLAAVPVGLHAQSGGRALTIEDYYRVLEVGAPQMSADAHWVAFTVSRRIEATNGDSSEVWVAAVSGSPAPRRVRSR